MSDSKFKSRVLYAIRKEKESSFNENKYYCDEGSGVYITPVTVDSCQRLIDPLTKWRSNNQHGFTKFFKVTTEGTEKWIYSALQDREDRILFIVFDKDKKMIGHLGVSTFDFENESCEIDNVVRGEVSCQRNIMYLASKILLNWIDERIRPRNILLRVLNNNVRALYLYHRLGFVPYGLEPLEKVEAKDEIEWVSLRKGKIDLFYIKMIYSS